MAASKINPVRLTGFAALREGLNFARDPLLATQRAYQTWGPFVILAEGLPFTARIRAVLLGFPLVFTAGADFNNEVLSDPDTWRGVSVLPGGPEGSAAKRMTDGLPRLTGHHHAHYRKLLLQPMRRTRVEQLSAEIAFLVEADLATWPVGENIDLWDYIRRLMQGLSGALLFGGDNAPSRAIAELSGRMMERKWGAGAFALPVNLPATTYRQIVRDSERLERLILDWVKEKRGHPDERDLASIIVNSPDANGNPADDKAIVAHVASLFALSSEGSVSALAWTLFLLGQHPRVAADLCDELRAGLGAASPALDKAGELRYLDAVVKESMRVLPPVPLQIKVAQRPATLAGYGVPHGTRVMLNTFLTNRTPDLYADGDRFQPTRWATLTPSAFEFPVFSAGPHLCPGFWFGTAAVKIALAAILARFRIEWPAGTRIDYRAQPTLRPKGRLGVVLRPMGSVGLPMTPVGGSIRSLVRLPG